MDLLNNDVPVRVIETDSDYELALEQVADLMSRAPATGSDSERLLKTLAVLVRDFESRQYPIVSPDPIKQSSFGWTNRDWHPRTSSNLGSRSRVLNPGRKATAHPPHDPESSSRTRYSGQQSFGRPTARGR